MCPYMRRCFARRLIGLTSSKIPEDANSSGIFFILSFFVAINVATISENNKKPLYLAVFCKDNGDMYVMCNSMCMVALHCHYLIFCRQSNKFGGMKPRFPQSFLWAFCCQNDAIDAKSCNLNAKKLIVATMLQNVATSRGDTGVPFDMR